MHRNTLTNTVVSISVGIPALNEENNVENLINSILRQKGDNFVINEITVICDGSTDNTPHIIKKLALSNQLIKLVMHSKRRGKSVRVNELIQKCFSDAFLLLDADILLGKETDISHMVSTLQQDSLCCMVGGRHIPVLVEDTFQAKTLLSNYLLWSEVHNHSHQYDSVYRVLGSALLMSKRLYRVTKLPDKLTCDWGYLYKIATGVGTFKYADKCHILEIPSTTFSDFRKAYYRTTREKKVISHSLNDNDRAQYNIPILGKIKAVLKRFKADPFFTTSAILLNVSILLFPYDDHLMAKGQWEILKSTKKRITTQ